MSDSHADYLIAARLHVNNGRSEARCGAAKLTCVEPADKDKLETWAMRVTID